MSAADLLISSDSHVQVGHEAITAHLASKYHDEPAALPEPERELIASGNAKRLESVIRSSDECEPMSDVRRSAPDDAFFWDGAAEGRLLIQRCADCGVLRHPPAPMCGACGSLAWDTAEASGRGRIVSWMYSLHPNRPDDEPRIVILVQLEEGTRLVSNLIDAPHSGPYDDLPVAVDFRDDRGTNTPFFRVAQ